MAAGPATVGTAFFARLGPDGDCLAAIRWALFIGLALFAAALACCFLLPRSGRAAQSATEPKSSPVRRRYASR